MFFSDGKPFLVNAQDLVPQKAPAKKTLETKWVIKKVLETVGLQTTPPFAAVYQEKEDTKVEITRFDSSGNVTPILALLSRDAFKRIRRGEYWGFLQKITFGEDVELIFDRYVRDRYNNDEIKTIKVKPNGLLDDGQEPFLEWYGTEWDGAVRYRRIPSLSVSAMYEVFDALIDGGMTVPQLHLVTCMDVNYLDGIQYGLLGGSLHNWCNLENYISRPRAFQEETLVRMFHRIECSWYDSLVTTSFNVPDVRVIRDNYIEAIR